MTIALSKLSLRRAAKTITEFPCVIVLPRSRQPVSHLDRSPRVCAHPFRCIEFGTGDAEIGAIVLIPFAQIETRTDAVAKTDRNR